MSHEKKSNKPAVLCIGPQKTATTWLFSNFKDHPQVWVPDVKERITQFVAKKIMAMSFTELLR